MSKVGTIEYFNEMKKKAINKVQDLTMEIDALRSDVYELEQKRNEYLKEIEDCNAEIKSIEDAIDRDYHEQRMLHDKVYHALNTPSQKKLI